MNVTSLHDLARQRLILETRYRETRRSYDDLHTQVTQHQARLSWQPEVKQVLETLQKKEHERSVGAYEQLLTALLQDVLPGPREVVMDLYTHAGLPALDIFLRKGLGQPLEDALHGTGGSVSNVLSAGLRAIALIRSGKRRFLVLDEADCWIRPMWAPRFAAVIQQMASQLGVQVLMISHHDESLFPMVPHRLRLEKSSEGLNAQWSPSAEIPHWEAEQNGLRSISLEDVQSHSMTYIPMAPGLTMLCGDNDIGKSAIVTALRAVFLNEANDTIVRHHQKSARVTLDFGPEHVLRWERFLKGKVKESFRHYSFDNGPEQPFHASDTAKTPDWLDPVFGIGLIDDLDVQLGHQKKTIFLLDKPNTMRARALAIGHDAGHVQTMMAIDKRETTEAKTMVKQGEKQLERLSRQIQALAPVIARQAEWERLLEKERHLEERQQMRAHQESLVLRWQKTSRRLTTLKDTNLLAPPLQPTLRFSQSHDYLARRWRRFCDIRKATDLLSKRSPPGTPPRLLAPASASLMQQWHSAQQRLAILETLGKSKPPQPPALLLDRAHLVLARRWKRALAHQAHLAPLKQHSLPALPQPTGAANSTALVKRWENALQQLHNAQTELQGIQAQEEAMGHDPLSCPQCGQPWNPSIPLP